MSDTLLDYYSKELAHIRHSVADFARKNPKIAKNLNLSPEQIKDPHVSHLIEAFAFINARSHFRLDDEYAETNEALLEKLYPHYLRPIPSVSVTQFVSAKDNTSKQVLPKNTVVESDPDYGNPCRFNTCYETALLPLDVVKAHLYGHCQTAPSLPLHVHANACLQLNMSCFSDEIQLSALKPGKIRFFLKGQHQHIFALYELLSNQTVTIALGKSQDDKKPIFLDKSKIKPVGLSDDEGILPYPSQSFSGYRLLTEFFLFPEKFLFLDLEIDDEHLKDFSNELYIYIYLERSTLALERNVTKDMFALGCTPMINLSKQFADPISVSNTQSEYPIIIDRRHQDAQEIYSIDKVLATSMEGEQTEVQAFYNNNLSEKNTNNTIYWHAQRRKKADNASEENNHTEMSLSLVDLEFNPSSAKNWTLLIETTCSDGNQPSRLPYGGGQPHLQFAESSAPVSKIQCLTPPSPSYAPELGNGLRWNLVSHLSLNHLSLTDDEKGVESLKEMLKLYNFKESAETRAMIDGIISLSTRRISTRSPDGNINAFCTGTEITVEFDEDRFAGNSVYLFASVLERFFALYCSINSFTKMIATTKGKKKIIKAWSPRTGNKTLL